MEAILSNGDLNNKPFDDTTKATGGAEIELFDGILFNVRNPDPDMIRISDIAHGLAFKCRYAGFYASNSWYSIAQHCCIAADITYDRTSNEDLSFKVLLHDAAEAYMQDIASPIKKFLPDYKQMESNLLEAIYKKYNAVPTKEEWEFIHKIDSEMYFREIKTFGIHQHIDVSSFPYFEGFTFQERESAKSQFLRKAFLYRL